MIATCANGPRAGRQRDIPASLPCGVGGCTEHCPVGVDRGEDDPVGVVAPGGVGEPVVEVRQAVAHAGAPVVVLVDEPVIVVPVPGGMQRVPAGAGLAQSPPDGGEDQVVGLPDGA